MDDFGVKGDVDLHDLQGPMPAREEPATEPIGLSKWIVMLRSRWLTDTVISRMWAWDEAGLRRIIRDLYPGYRIETMRRDDD